MKARKILSVLLAVILLFGAFGTVAFAHSGDRASHSHSVEHWQVYGWGYWQSGTAENRIVIESADASQGLIKQTQIDNTLNCASPPFTYPYSGTNDTWNFTAKPNAGYEFSHWEFRSGSNRLSGASTTNPNLTVTHPGYATPSSELHWYAKAHFKPIVTTFTVNFNGGKGNGKVTAKYNDESVLLEYNESHEYTYASGVNSLSLEFTPLEGYTFDRSQVNDGGGWNSNNPRTVSVNSSTNNININAKWNAIPTYTLNIVTGGEGSGTVSKDPEKTSYNEDEVVSLEATPDEDSTFRGFFDKRSGNSWKGYTYSNPLDPAQVTMDDDKTIYAVFDLKPTYTFNIVTGGEGSGTVSKDPDEANYAQGTVVNLSATPDEDSTFRGFFDKRSGNSWQGYTYDDSDKLDPAQVTMDGDKKIYAVFDLKPKYTLTINKIPSNNQSNVLPANVSSHDPGTDVELNGNPNSSSRFVGFFSTLQNFNYQGSSLTRYIGYMGSSPTVTMDDDKTVYALYSNNGHNFNHIDVDFNGILTINRYVNGQFDGTEQINIETSNVSAKIGNMTVPNSSFKADSAGLEWSTREKATLSYKWPSAVTVYATLTDKNDSTRTFEYEHTFTERELAIAYARCPGVEAQGTKGFDFYINAEEIKELFTHDVTFVAGEGGTISGNTSYENFPDNKSLDDYNYEVPTADANAGYAFVGWQDAEGTEYTSEDVGALAITKDMTFTAIFEQITHAIQTSVTNGTISPENPEVAEGGNQTITYEPSTGHHLASVTVDGSSVDTIANASSYTFSNVTDDHTIDVVFEANTHDIIFYVDGEEHDRTAGVAFGTGLTDADLIDEPTKTGYTFSGWSALPAEMPDEDVSVYGTFAANTHKITYFVDGEVHETFDDVAFGTDLTPIDAPTRTGYTFSGWIGLPETMPDEDVEVNGTFAVNTHDITYYVDGRIHKTINDVAFGTGLTPIAEPTKNGYTFSGWSEMPETMPDSNVEVYGTFAANTYTVIYHGGEGSTGSTETSNHTYGTYKKLTANGFAKEGYTFAGWATSQGGWVRYLNTQYVRNLTSEPNGIVNLYAVWVPKAYIVNYDRNGGSGRLMLPTAHVYDTARKLRSNSYTKVGHTFAGWATTPDGDVEYANGVSVVNLTADYEFVTLYAVWDINEYTVTFVDHDGTELDQQTVEHGSGATAPDEPDNKEGYHFTGWDKEFDNVTGNLTVTALYEINEYTVTFVDHDGTELDQQTVEHGSGATAPDEPDNKEGYHFTGWDKEFDNVTGNLTVTALYEINEYTVTFVDHDGTVLKTEQVEHGKAATAPEGPERTGYTFTGWDISYAPVTGHMTVTAQYEINTYEAAFVSNGGNEVPAQTVTYNALIGEPEDPTRVGHAFSGWFADSTLETEWDFANDAMPANDVTLYAAWTPNAYTVRFEDYDGTLIARRVVLYNGAATAPAGPQREGYTFTGWDRDFNRITRNITVTAMFEINTYTVRFVDHDDTLIAEQNVEWNTGATAPADPQRDGYAFIGWDTAFNAVTADITVTAQYDPVEVIVPEPVPEDGEPIDEEPVPKAGPSNDWLWWLLLIPGIGLLLWLLFAWLLSVVPIAESVSSNGDGTYTVQWGYENRKFGKYTADEGKSVLSTLVGKIIGGSKPPVEFEKGRKSNVFTTVVNDGSAVQWKVNNRKAKVDLTKEI